jgi:DNA polymerase III alpha subunit
VVARQRPMTASGYVFVLMEDEYGPVNVIIKPAIYDRDRISIRMEPFLMVRGRLQKDGATMNVIAREVKALRPDDSQGPRPMHTPGTGSNHSFEYLTALRQSPPGVKNFG